MERWSKKKVKSASVLKRCLEAQRRFWPEGTTQRARIEQSHARICAKLIEQRIMLRSDTSSH